LTRLRIGDEEVVADLKPDGPGWRAIIGSAQLSFAVEPAGPGVFVLLDAERRRVFHCVREGSTIHLFWDGVAYRIEEQKEGARPGHRRDKGGLEATMPGKVIAVKASAGQSVKKGDEVVVVEAMKMENALRAPRDGTIKTVSVKVGDMVGPGEVLVELE
jgi:acetyl/propionyl-CoA carboxylase alpha subunit